MFAKTVISILHNIMKKNRDYFTNFKLRTKFLIIMIPCSVISSIVIMVLSFYVFVQYEDKLYQSTIQSLDISVDNIESELQKIENVSDNLTTNSILQTALRFEKPNIRKKEASSEYNSLAIDFYHLLKNEYDKNDSDIISASVFVENEWYYIGNLPKKINSKVLERMKNKLSAEEENEAWFPDEYPGDRMFYARKIKEISGNFQTLGVLLIECDFKSIIQSRLKENKNLDYTPNIHILGEDGEIYSDIEQASALEEELDGNPYGIVTIDGEKYFAAYMETSVYSWHCFTLIPFNDVFGSIARLKLVFILVDILIIIVAVLFCRYLLFSLTRHFDNLVKKMQIVQNGDFNICESISYAGRNDEIGFIHQSFDDMVRELDKLIKDNYIKQLLIQENKLKMLQQQLNPHFLFNTLQTINWKAKDNKPEEVSQIAEALGKLLRYTLREEEDPVPLSEELKILYCYVDIQKLRYQERLNVFYDVPESLYSQTIPKLSLQNVVENSIKYALEAMIEPCVIRIWAREDRDSFWLYVEDNGPGIDETALITGGERKSDKQVYGLGIGLSNISQRIKLLFSDKYSLILHNTGNGTRIEFYLPKTENEIGGAL